MNHDLLNAAIFAMALVLGLIQHLLDGPAVPLVSGPLRRWWANGVLFAADTASITLFAAAVTWLTRTDAPHFLPQMAIGGQPVVLQVGILLMLHSFVQYWLHRAGHRVPRLWTWHRIHHADTALDATTGLRLHPFEAVLNYLGLLCATLILSPSAGGLLGYILLGIAFALFTHMNPRWIPGQIDRAVSAIIMTPRLHQLHHSTWQPETDTNYGNIIVIWDRVFGTYLAAPTTPRNGFALGLDEVPLHKANDPFLQIAAPFLPLDMRDHAGHHD